MSVTLRLARIGKKHAPAYKIVASNTRSKRNGKFIEVLGNYNPSEDAKKVVIDTAKYDTWLKKGALVSNSLKELVEGKYVYKHYKGKKLEDAEAKAAEAKVSVEENKVEDTVIEETAVEDVVEQIPSNETPENTPITETNEKETVEEANKTEVDAPADQAQNE